MHNIIPEIVRNTIIIGCGSFLCGGFTTFSTFSKEALIMLQAGQIWRFAGYIALSVVTGIALVALGYVLMK